MFWNNEFLDPSPSHIDVLLQTQTVKLSDILFEDDLLQELKTSNANLANFLIKREVINELVENITRLTEKDCCDKLLYSRVHAAYISCEIITSSSEILTVLFSFPESLNKIITCLTIQPKQQTFEPVQSSSTPPPQEPPISPSSSPKPPPSPSSSPQQQQLSTSSLRVSVKDKYNESEERREDPQDREATQQLDQVKHQSLQQKRNQSRPKEQEQPKEQKPSAEELEEKKDPSINNLENKIPDNGNEDCSQDSNKQEFTTMTKVVPQKATLVSKLISTIHSIAAPNLGCHITQDIASFSELVGLLVQNIDISGSFEILSTFIKRTSPPESRYVFCEVLSKLNFVQNLIDVMTLSDIEDKQRNACQLLCDIIVIGRQEASEQPYPGPITQDVDMLAELLESAQAVRVILNQIFSENMRNSTAIVCGMKVLQTLIEQKCGSDAQIAQTIEQTQEEIEKHLINFHELLLNPPKQEPIKTTFGIIQKPLGYMRLEVVNSIRALISTNSPNIIKKLVELRTMKVIIDLFFEYSWNNLLHTQVEQALCLIINNYRRDEEFYFMLYHIRAEDESHTQQQSHTSEANDTENGSKENEEQQEPIVKSNEQQQQSNQDEQQQQQTRYEQSVRESPSRALLSQLLEECDLIGRLLSPCSMKCGSVEQNNKEKPSDDSKEGEHNETVSTVNKKTESTDDLREIELERQRRRNGEQANFGHIIQMINSIAINRDLDTIGTHLDKMKDKRPELYDKWTTFVNVDVASFKEISLYYDAQSANKYVNQRLNHAPNTGLDIDSNIQWEVHQAEREYGRLNYQNDNSEYVLAYFSFDRETVLPAINVDVLPKLRRVNNKPSREERLTMKLLPG